MAMKFDGSFLAITLITSFLATGCDSSSAESSPTTATPSSSIGKTTMPVETTRTGSAGGSSSSGSAAAAPSTASAVTGSNSDDACLAAMPASVDALFASHKKVFAHYFYPFPKSLDNKQPQDDYYNTEFLTKDGEKGKWLAQGGFLRQRPLGETPRNPASWHHDSLEADIRAAIARGITGFTFNAFSTKDIAPGGQVQLMLESAAAVDPRFKIVIMPDITSLHGDSQAVVDIIKAVAGSPSAYHLSDGRLVVSAFDASLNSATWWRGVLTTLKNDGVNVAFVPTFLSLIDEAAAFAPISYGFGEWGTAMAGASEDTGNDAALAHSKYGKISMLPINAQQFRPKDFLYWEASNSSSFRNGWLSAIHGGADWVQLVTWNDFSESGEIAPYTDATLQRNIGTGYYNLNAYYSAWFLIGTQPEITHDVLYYFYRREPTTAHAPAQHKQDTIATGASSDEIELLAFLTEPGQLSININGHTYTHDASAGITSFKVALQAGTPTFALARNGANVFSFKGGVQIYGSAGLPSGVEDLTYWSGSASRTGICTL